MTTAGAIVLLFLLIFMAAVIWGCRRIYRGLPPEVRAKLDDHWMFRDLN